MEETVIGVEGPNYEVGGLNNCRAGNACGCRTVPESEGITAIEANENAQPSAAEEPATESVEIEACIDKEPCGEGELYDCLGKYDDDCPYDNGDAFTVIGFEEEKPTELKTTTKKEPESLQIEFVLPDDGNTLNYRGKKILSQHKSDVRQMVAKEELRFKYYDGSETQEVVIPAGTRGGYVSKDARVENAWLDDRSIVYGPTVENCYIVDSSIHSYGYIEDSYLSGCKCEHYIDLDVRRSTLFSIDFKGECLVDKSHLAIGEIKSSRVERCRNLRGFEIFNSVIERVSGVTGFIVNGAGIKDADKDFLQVTNVGTARRTVCAYRTPRGGVMVSTGCFRGTLDELAIANAQSHLGYNMSDSGYLVKNRSNVNRNDEWCYKEYDMLIKYIRHHFKLDVNTMTIPTKY